VKFNISIFMHLLKLIKSLLLLLFVFFVFHKKEFQIYFIFVFIESNITKHSNK